MAGGTSSSNHFEEGEDESVLSLSEQTNRPSDTAFNQQRIQAWHPILDPWWVIAALFYLGIIMVPTGYKIESIQDAVEELKETYDDVKFYESDELKHSCQINEHYNANKTCMIELTAKEDMTPPILIHYELTNFHQNHRSYYNSRDPYQLRGEEATGTAASGVKLDCEPLYQLGNIKLNPCGLTANTMFNDIFKLVNGKDAFGNDLLMIEEGIAWASDMEFMFAQPLGFRYEVCPTKSTGNNSSLSSPCPRDCCDGDDWSCDEPFYDEKVDKCYRYYYPNEDTTQYLYETYPKIVNPIEGVLNEHFIVWMRIAAHGTFRKLYGWIDQPIRKGETLTFEVNANYVVKRFRGSKSLIVSTTSIFGGKNSYFSSVFIGIGYYCFIVGTLFAFKQYFFPRKIGDEKYLHYKEH